MKELCSAMNVTGVHHNGNWTQALNWLHDDPQSLVKSGIYHREQVKQVAWLEGHAQFYFGARRCVGLAGSYRRRGIPMAGSLVWSILLRGECHEAFFRIP